MTRGPLRKKTCLPGFKKRDSNQPAQLQRLSRKVEISPVASLDMILSKKRKTKGADQTVRMHRLVCALVVRNIPKTGFSHVEAHVMYKKFKTKTSNISKTNVFANYKSIYILFQFFISTKWKNISRAHEKDWYPKKGILISLSQHTYILNKMNFKYTL